MPARRDLSLLADNLACRRRLGLGLVRGAPGQLAQIVSGNPKATSDSSLEHIRTRMGECIRCPLHQKRQKIVFGQGAPHAAIMFIGEAPGAQEDRQGVPFVGPAGQLLDRMLAAVGLKREDVYITNIVKCRPPGNRDPRPEEAAACREFLTAQVEAIDPRLICTLGRPAAHSVLETTSPISALRGNWHTFMARPCLPTFHPAFLLRQPERKAEAYRDFKALVRALG